jgi:hypothetical protein
MTISHATTSRWGGEARVLLVLGDSHPKVENWQWFLVWFSMKTINENHPSENFEGFHQLSKPNN